MNTKQWQATALMAVLCTVGLHAQVVNNVTGDYRLTSGTNTPKSFTIGGSFFAGASAFNIRGDQMGGTSATPEVFRTNAPTTGNTFWRMFQGGTTAGFERGQLFAVPGQDHFNINAPNGHLRLYTNSVERARMNENISTTINGSSSFKPGFVGLSPGGSLWSTGPGPFSRLHLDDGTGLITNPYRPWMRNGISMTGNDDFMYVGQLYRAGFDESDAVIAWGDNALAPAGPDHLRFLFMGDAIDLEGTEVSRITGEGFFGIGDFDAAAAQPDERLDLLTRTARIRQLPSATYQAPTTDDDKVMVVRSDGRVNWRDAASLTDCDWAIDPATGNVLTAFWPGVLAPTCPDQTNSVGIGTALPLAKLDVVKVIPAGGIDMGVRSEILISTGTKSAIEGINLRAGDENFGIRLSVDGASRNWGVVSLTGAGVTGGSVVSGYFDANGENVTTDPIAVWGRAYGNAPIGGAGWAAFLEGRGYLANGPWVLSDASFKQNITPLQQNALGVIASLQPKSYEFDLSIDPTMGMPTGPQVGFLAQDLEQVLPALVTEVNRPERVDSLGQVVVEARTFKAVNYEGIIPYLVGAMQEQNARIDQLQAQLAQCCSTGATDSRSMQQGTGSSSTGMETDLRIIPNPVAANTLLRYTVGTPGRVRLEVSDGMGRVIEVLEESTRSTGEFTYDWNTQQLSAGTYYCTLFVNDEPLVKKAVKLNER